MGSREDAKTRRRRNGESPFKKPRKSQEVDTVSTYARTLHPVKNTAQRIAALMR
jgi:hypothetical protein